MCSSIISKKVKIWQCEFCNYVSIKKWNVQVNEKIKHSNQIENINNEVKNNQINNKEIKVGVETIYYNKTPEPMATIGDHMNYVRLKDNKKKVQEMI